MTDTQPDIRVGHDDRAVTGLPEHDQSRLITDVPADMPEPASLLADKEAVAHAIRVALRPQDVDHAFLTMGSEHGPSHLPGEDVVRSAARREAHLDGQGGEIRRSAPGPAGGHRRIHLPSALERAAVDACAGCGHGWAGRRQGLLERAVAHVKRAEDSGANEVRE